MNIEDYYKDAESSITTLRNHVSNLRAALIAVSLSKDNTEDAKVRLDKATCVSANMMAMADNLSGRLGDLLIKLLQADAEIDPLGSNITTRKTTLEDLRETVLVQKGATTMEELYANIRGEGKMVEVPIQQSATTTSAGHEYKQSEEDKFLAQSEPLAQRHDEEQREALDTEKWAREHRVTPEGKAIPKTDWEKEFTGFGPSDDTPALRDPVSPAEAAGVYEKGSSELLCKLLNKPNVMSVLCLLTDAGFDVRVVDSANTDEGHWSLQLRKQPSSEMAPPFLAIWHPNDKDELLKPLQDEINRLTKLYDEASKLAEKRQKTIEMRDWELGLIHKDYELVSKIVKELRGNLDQLSSIGLR
jgi:hypothetical protein